MIFIKCRGYFIYKEVLAKLLLASSFEKGGGKKQEIWSFSRTSEVCI